MEDMMKTADEFKVQAEKKEITGWDSHGCSLCGYVVGYKFKDGHVGYDNGCDCTGGQNVRMSSWEEVAESYNMQSNENVIRKMNEFWGFE